MTPQDEAAWAEELADLLTASMRILRWVGLLVTLYIAASIGAAWGAM